MKPNLALVILITGILTTGCSKFRFNFLQEKDKLVAIQPLGDFDTSESVIIRKEIERFYDKKVIILNPIAIPPGYMVSQSNGLYEADSILNLLSSLLNDTITEVVGLTHTDICTLREAPDMQDRPAFYDIKNIFGIAHLPGHVCLISDYRLKDPDPSVLQHRIKTVLLHEMGHNLGLAHCPATQCPYVRRQWQNIGA